MSDQSSNHINTRTLAAFLRRLAKEIEENPDLATKLLNSTMPKPRARKRDGSMVEGLDLYALRASGGEATIREKLEPCDVAQLRRIVQRNGLDPSKLAEKWRNKERLVNFIVDTVMERARLGDVFFKSPLARE